MSPSQTTHDSLIDAATREFADAGFAGARVDAIARRSGVNKAMIYYHFKSKRGLYKAVLLGLFAPVVSESERLLAAEPDPLRRLAAFYERVAQLFAERPALPQIMVREVVSGGKGMDAEVSRALGAILRFVRSALEQGGAQGRFRRVNPLLVHLGILGPILLFSAGRSFRERVIPAEMPGLRQPSPAEVVAHLIEFLERGLAPLPAATARPVSGKERS